MNQFIADSIIKGVLDRDEAVNFGHHITQVSKNEDGEIHLNLIKPRIENEVIKSMTYTIQVMANISSFSDQFHKDILYGLQEVYGNAKSVDFVDDNTSILKWKLGDIIKLDLTIDKEEDIYTLEYVR